MKYLFFILIDLSAYPFLLILFLSKLLLEKVKFVPLLYKQNGTDPCTSERLLARKK